MEIIVIIASLLAIVLPIIILVIGIQREKKKRTEERNEIFSVDETKIVKPIKIKTESIDAVAELSKILQDEVEKATKSKTKPVIKKQIKKKKSEFPIEPTDHIKPKSKRGRKPRNNDKKGGDQMLLS